MEINKKTKEESYRLFGCHFKKEALNILMGIK